MLSVKEIRERQTDALGHELLERQKHLFDLRTQAVTEKLEDPSQLRKTKKEIARIKTILRQRVLESQKKVEQNPAPAAAPAKAKRAARKQKVES